MKIRPHGDGTVQENFKKPHQQRKVNMFPSIFILITYIQQPFHVQCILFSILLTNQEKRFLDDFSLLRDDWKSPNQLDKTAVTDAVTPHANTHADTFYRCQMMQPWSEHSVENVFPQLNTETVSDAFALSTHRY